MPATPRTILRQDFPGEIRSRFLFQTGTQAFCTHFISPPSAYSMCCTYLKCARAAAYNPEVSCLCSHPRGKLNLPAVSQCSSNLLISVRNTCAVTSLFQIPYIDANLAQASDLNCGATVGRSHQTPAGTPQDLIRARSISRPCDCRIRLVQD
ncbi:hypothetical protein B0H13DRAFT_1086031 [Mycena leptocephala]|nr:hypothetical protein B0H13DRAFT_1086031 [Mycena leptocephala]